MSGRHRKPTTSAVIMSRKSPSPAQSSAAEASPSPGMPAPPPTANGTRSHAANPAATGPSTPATDTRAACSSPRAPGRPTAAASTRPPRTWPPRKSRSPSPSACSLRQGRGAWPVCGGPLSGATPRNVVDGPRRLDTSTSTASCRPRRRLRSARAPAAPEAHRSTRLSAPPPDAPRRRPRRLSCRLRPPLRPWLWMCRCPTRRCRRLAARRRRCPTPAADAPLPDAPLPDARCPTPLPTLRPRRPSWTPCSSRRRPMPRPSRIRTSRRSPRIGTSATLPRLGLRSGRCTPHRCRSTRCCRIPAPPTAGRPHRHPIRWHRLNAVDIPAPAFDAANQAMTGELPTPPDGIPHLASPDNLPTGTTMDAVALPAQSPNVSVPQGTVARDPDAGHHGQGRAARADPAPLTTPAPENVNGPGPAPGAEVPPPLPSTRLPAVAGRRPGTAVRPSRTAGPAAGPPV